MVVITVLAACLLILATGARCNDSYLDLDLNIGIDLHVGTQPIEEDKTVNNGGTEPIEEDKTKSSTSARCPSLDVNKYRLDSIQKIPITGAFVDVLTDLQTDGGEWTIIQKRNSAAVDFYRDWASYFSFFGDVCSNYWVGLQMIHQLCNPAQSSVDTCELRIDMSHRRTDYHADYSTFCVSTAYDNFQLRVSGYSGDAGDGFDGHDGMMFTTKDRDNDRVGLYNCAEWHRAAWWFSTCGYSSLNGPWVNGAQSYTFWKNLTQGSFRSFDNVEMKLRIHHDVTGFQKYTVEEIKDEDLNLVVSYHGVTETLMCQPGSVIFVHEAKYGVKGCGSLIDVKTDISNDCHLRQSCSVLANEHYSFDTCPGQLETVNVTYTCRRYARFQSNDPLLINKHLVCDYGSEITILKATWGVEGCGVSDVAYAFQSDCNNELVCPVSANDIRFGRPCTSQPNAIDVEFICRIGTDKFQTKVGETKEIRCQVGLIRILEAKFWREGCSGAGVKYLISTACDDKVNCTIMADESVLGPSCPNNRDTCKGLYRSLDVIHTCQIPEREKPLPVPCNEDIAIITCGHQDLEPATPRIIGGQDANRGSWPWNVLIFYYIYDNNKNQYGWKQVATGSIISPEVILTAAHMFRSYNRDISNTSRWRVHAGMNDRTVERVIMQVQEIIVHEHFSDAKFDNDIALVLLSSPLTFTPYIRPVCLPSASLGVTGGQKCWVTGWGLKMMPTRGPDPWGNTPRPQYDTSDILQQLDVDVINETTCSSNDWYGGHPRYSSYNKFCAGYANGGKDACSGDSGGPLVCKIGNTGRWYAQGIVSWAESCAKPKRPGIYTDVSKYTLWLQEKMSSNVHCNAPIVG